VHTACVKVYRIFQPTGNTLVRTITCVRGKMIGKYENVFNSKRFLGTFFVTI